MIKSINKTSISNINFTKLKTQEITNSLDNKITERNLSTASEKLIKKTGDMFECLWSLIRKGKLISEDLEQKIKVNIYSIKLKPLYNDPHMTQYIMQIKNDKDKNFYENIIFDKDGKNYVYEKVMQTDFGYATLKTRNSKIQTDFDTNEKVNYYLEKFLPKYLQIFNISYDV